MADFNWTDTADLVWVDTADLIWYDTTFAVAQAVVITLALYPLRNTA